MWRPFLSHFTNHTLDQFIKKNIKIEVIPVCKKPKKYKRRLLNTDLFPFKHTPFEEEKRLEKFEKL